MNKNYYKISKLSKAFTLVELLIVMAILSVLVSIIAGGFRSSQARGRDTQRKSDLKQVANSLELYYSDYSKYPDSLTWGSQFTDGKTIYFKVLPPDPIGNLTYFYRVPDTPDNQKFQLFGYLENTQDPDRIITNYSCGAQTCNFAITSSNTSADE